MSTKSKSKTRNHSGCVILIKLYSFLKRFFCYKHRANCLFFFTTNSVMTSLRSISLCWCTCITASEAITSHLTWCCEVAFLASSCYWSFILLHTKTSTETPGIRHFAWDPGQGFANNLLISDTRWSRHGTVKCPLPMGERGLFLNVFTALLSSCSSRDARVYDVQSSNVCCLLSWNST